MKRNNLSYLIFLAMALVGLSGCIEDGYSSSPSDQPSFSVDTLHMGVIFTDEPSTTHRFTVYNRASKSINISRIGLSGDNAQLFRLNVDGFSGRTFSDVEIRANDSIYIFVETTLPSNGLTVPLEVTSSLDFTTNGLTRSVTLAATGRDVERINALTINENTTLRAGRPYRVTDSLVVAPGVALTLEPGVEMLFHDKAHLTVHGSLQSLGTLDRPVVLTGDRTGNVASDIPFDLMSRQWDGVYFTPSSRANRMEHTLIKNTASGVVVDGTGSAEPVDIVVANSRLRNSGANGLELHNAALTAYNSEFAEAAYAALYVNASRLDIDQCTLSNYYLFAAIGSPILTFDPEGLEATSATIDNTIIYGLGSDVSEGDLTGTDIFLRNCLLKSEGTNDDNFINCIWGEDPLFHTIREDYIFDYRLKPESPAIGRADPALNRPECATDILGTVRPAAPSLGAYEFTADQAAQ